MSVAAGLLPVKAVWACDPIGTGAAIVTCSGDYPDGLLFQEADTSIADSSHFIFENAIVSGLATFGNDGSAVHISSNELDHTVGVSVDHNISAAPAFKGRPVDAGFAGPAVSNGFTVSTSGDQSGITFEVNQRLTGSAGFTGADAMSAIGSATAAGVSLATSGEDSAISVTVKEMTAQGGSTTGVPGVAHGLAAATSASGSTISFIATDSEFTGGAGYGAGNDQGSASGIDLITGGDEATISAQFNQVQANGGMIVGIGSADGLNVVTSGSGASVTVVVTDTNITGGEVTDSAGRSDGVRIATSGANSGISLTQNTGTIASGTGASISHGVHLLTEGAASGIVAGFDGASLATAAAEGIAVSAEVADGDVALTFGADAIASGSAAGAIATASGSVTITLEGSAGQTGLLVDSADLASLVPVGLGGVTDGSGDVIVTAQAGSTITQVGALSGQTENTEGTGILALADGTGNSTLVADGAVTATGIGVAAIARDGNASLEIGGAITVTGATGSSALEAFGLSDYYDLNGETVGGLVLSDNGAASLTFDGGSIASSPDIGLFSAVQGGAGNVSIEILSSADAAATINSGLFGVAGFNLGSGDVSITQTGYEAAGVPAYSSIVSGGVGMLGFAREGDVFITSGNIQSGANYHTVDVLDLDGGVVGVSLAGNVQIDTLGTIDAAGSQYGILALSYGGTIGVDAGAGITAGSVGINANGIGSLSVAVTLQDNVAVSAGFAGIFASNMESAGAIDVMIGEGSTVDSDGSGVMTRHFGSGATVIEVGTGATVQGGAGAAIDMAASVLAPTALSIDNSGLIQASGSVATVNLLSGGTISIHNQADGEIYGAGGTSSGSAIEVTSNGSLDIVNDGTLLGSVGVYANGMDDDGVSIEFDNNSANGWQYGGIAYFGGTGGIAFTNSEDGIVETAGSLTFFQSLNGDIQIENAGEFTLSDHSWLIFDNLAGGTSTISNSGILNATDVSLLEGLANFDNSGAVNLANADTNDVLITDGNFNGLSGSVLSLDAELAPGGGADLLIAGGSVASGPLVLTAGSLTGTTLLEVTDLDSEAGRYTGNDNAILFALAGSSDGGTIFTTEEGYDKGLFRYDVFMRETPQNFLGFEEWVLASTPDAEAYELATLAYGAQNLWHVSADAWLDRANTATGIWVKTFGGALERDLSQELEAAEGLVGATSTHEDRLHQDYRGVMAGFDFGEETVAMSGREQSWAVGIMAGYGGSEFGFQTSSTEAEYKQGSAGLYAAYVSEGFFAEAALKGDFGRMSYEFSDGSGYSDSAEVDYRSLGAIANLGYRMDHGHGWYLEPKATLAYVHTDIDDFDVLGTAVAISGDSLRGRLGMRVGSSIERWERRFDSYLEANLWNEFKQGGAAWLAGDDLVLPVGHDASGAYGEIAAGVGLTELANGWKSFARGAVQLGGDDFRAWSGSVGIRKSW